MSVIPIISVTRLLSILLRIGFVILRQKGSHIRLWHPITRRLVTVPFHVGDLTRKMLATILKQAGISAKEFLRLLGR